MSRDLFTRAFRVGIAGPVGSGKTSLIDLLTQRLARRYEFGVVTNDIYTKEDAEYLLRQGVLTRGQVRGVQTGGYPHEAIREDITVNLEAVAEIEARNPNVDVIFIESGGDNLATAFSPALADVVIFVLDAAAGERSPRKAGPGMLRSELLVINKIDLASRVGASLLQLRDDSQRLRGDRPLMFTNLKTGEGINEVVEWLVSILTPRLGPRPEVGN